MKTRTNIYFYFLSICVALILMVAGAILQSSSTDTGKMLQAELHNPSLWALDIASILFVILTFWIGIALRNQEVESKRLLDEQQKLRELDAQRTAELLTQLAAQDEQLKLMLNKLDVVESEIQRNSETALLPISDRTNSLQRQMEAVHLALQYQRGDLQQVRHALRAMPVASLLSTDREITPYTMSITPGSVDSEAESIEIPHSPEINLSFSEPQVDYSETISTETLDPVTPQFAYFQEEVGLNTPSLESADYTPDSIEMVAETPQIDENYSIPQSTLYPDEQDYDNELITEHQIEPVASSVTDLEKLEPAEMYDPIDNLTADDTPLADALEDQHRRDVEAIDSEYSTAPVEAATASDVFPSWFRDLLPDTEIEEPVIPMEEVSSIYDEYFESQTEPVATETNEIEYTTISHPDPPQPENENVETDSESEEYIISHDASEWSANDASTIVMPPISLQMDPDLESALYPPHHDVLYPIDSILQPLTEEDSETTPVADTILHPAGLTVEEMNLLTAPLPNPEEQINSNNEYEKANSEDEGRTGWHRKL